MATKRNFRKNHPPYESYLLTVSSNRLWPLLSRNNNWNFFLLLYLSLVPLRALLFWMRTLTGRSIQYHILGPVLDLEGTSQIQYSLISQSRRKQRTQIIAYPESCPSGNSNLPPRYMESTFKRGGGGNQAICWHWGTWVWNNHSGKWDYQWHFTYLKTVIILIIQLILLIDCHNRFSISGSPFKRFVNLFAL